MDCGNLNRSRVDRQTGRTTMGDDRTMALSTPIGDGEIEPHVSIGFGCPLKSVFPGLDPHDGVSADVSPAGVEA